jgi:thiol-disulfide isomerase/thioredoxin
MTRNAMALSVALILGLAGYAAAEGLGVGDPAPKLEVQSFVMGDALKGFVKDKIYVVEFWATWCGPCRATIPHLTELQKKHKDVVFIGVSVWEQNQAEVKPFVAKMGDKMDYRVALDTAKGNDGKMAQNWMKAAEQDGIPTAFIINGEGKVAWIGHPMELDKPLDKVVAGKWDLATAAVDFKKARAAKVKMRQLTTRLREAQKADDPKKLLEVVDEAIKDEPALEANLGWMKVQALVKTGEVNKAVEYGNRLVDGALEDKEQSLNALAWALVEKPGEKPNPDVMKMALRAAQKADKLAEGKDAAIADTLAKAWFENGEPAKALEVQERAVKLAKGTPLEADKEVQQRLELYKKAVKK